MCLLSGKVCLLLLGEPCLLLGKGWSQLGRDTERKFSKRVPLPIARIRHFVLGISVSFPGSIHVNACMCTKLHSVASESIGFTRFAYMNPLPGSQVRPEL